MESLLQEASLYKKENAGSIHWVTRTSSRDDELRRLRRHSRLFGLPPASTARLERSEILFEY
jgi:hypothetical protein